MGSDSFTIYQRASDSRWVAAMDESRMRDQPRRRKTLSATSHEDLLRRIAEAWPSIEPRPTRAEQWDAARAKGRHSKPEWYALVRASRSVCAYCARWIPYFSITKDHRVPVSRGGSDGIENLLVACWDCNQHKRGMTEEEFRAHIARTGWIERLRGKRPNPSPNGKLALARIRARRAAHVQA